jgi:RimJ/RimL family protein N-acetyltransferase
MWADPLVVRHISGVPSNQSETWSRLLRYIGHWQAMGFGYWVIEDKTSNSFLGEAGFADFKRQIEPPLGNTPEAGWVLIPNSHGRGLASEAVAAMLQWADRHLQSHSTVCIMNPEHTASRRVAEKNGYRYSRMADFRGEKTMVMERMKLSLAP